MTQPTTPSRSSASPNTAPSAAIEVSGPGEVRGSVAILQHLMAVIEDRKANPPAKSYTTKLFEGGVPKIGGKILEEAREVVEAASEPGPEGRAHVIYEAADVTYHLMVLLGHLGIGWSEVESELGRRFGISGIDEKAARPPKP
ncbi:MAG: Phosphoribosyl-ATP pyrophosphatase [Planctomycetota bacterium]|jgi:phosphoribosyl-ATP pyrophosphohydrolase